MKICIDISHGGSDSGASSEGVHEKHIVFQYGKLLKKVLEEEGHDVVVTRDGDYLPSFQQRADIANSHNSDLCISCHINGATPQANGIETIYWHGSEKGKEFAQLVNDELVKSLGWADRGIKSHKELGRNLAILRMTKMPTVIIEPGFVSNPKEREYMQTCEYRSDVVNAIKKAIDKWGD